MKERLKNLCDWRVTALIIIQSALLLSNFIKTCADFSSGNLVGFIISCAISLWLISGLVKIKKNAIKEGTKTIRGYMKFAFVILCIVSGIVMISAAVLFVVLLKVDKDQASIVMIIDCFLILLIAFLVYSLYSFNELKNTAKRACDIAGGAKSIGRQGKIAEIYCLVSMLIWVVSLLWPLFGFTIIDVIVRAISVQLPGVLTTPSMSLTGILTPVLNMIGSFIAYTLLRDFRKTVNK